MCKKYGIAVIGAGGRGRAYTSAIAGMKETKLVTVCDIQEDRMKRFKNEFGFVKEQEDYKEAIADNDIDIVVICTPAYLHPEIAIYGMEHNKHVISEKPMALSLKRAHDMIDAAEKRNCQLALGFQYHNISKFRKMKQVFDRGMLGHPIMMTFSDIRETRPKIKMHDAKYGNGGPIVDMACHFIDQMRYFFDSDPVSVTAKDYTFASDRPQLKEVENKAPDTASIMVEFGSGNLGVLNLCWGLPAGVNGRGQYQAIGVNGYVDFTSDDVVCRLEGGKLEAINLTSEDEKELENPQVTVVHKLIEAVEGKGQPQRGGHDGYIALATSLAAIKSSKLGRPVSLNEIFEEEPDVMKCMGAQI